MVMGPSRPDGSSFVPCSFSEKEFNPGKYFRVLNWRTIRTILQPGTSLVNEVENLLRKQQTITYIAINSQERQHL
jgi:hypothetical protein